MERSAHADSSCMLALALPKPSGMPPGIMGAAPPCSDSAPASLPGSMPLGRPSFLGPPSSPPSRGPLTPLRPGSAIPACICCSRDRKRFFWSGGMVGWSARRPSAPGCGKPPPSPPGKPIQLDCGRGPCPMPCAPGPANMRPGIMSPGGPLPACAMLPPGAMGAMLAAAAVAAARCCCCCCVTAAACAALELDRGEIGAAERRAH
mmetsp:Transcript_6409/g.16609  ORF Transcript_6409/g.16609 Transcript_6409/m.16609 type:complete len:205 (-) Transcript_6409:132-746(-)